MALSERRLCGFVITVHWQFVVASVELHLGPHGQFAKLAHFFEFSGMVTLRDLVMRRDCHQPLTMAVQRRSEHA